MADEQCHYFIIGPRQEKIAVPIDNWQTCSHMLGDIKLDEDSLEMPDLDPVAFKIFLQYASGTKNLGSNWKTQTVFDVCYLANKFHLNDLRETAAQLLWPFGVFELFNALRCVVEYKAICIEPAVRKIVQEETTLMFEQPQFNSLDKECLLYILTQDILNADELAVWKAVLGWARHQVFLKTGVENGPTRVFLEEPLKFVRLNNLTAEQFCQEVEPANVFSEQELADMKKSLASEIIPEAPSTHKRLKPSPLEPLYTKHGGVDGVIYACSSSFIFKLMYSIKLTRLVCYGTNCSSPSDVSVTLVLSCLWAYQYEEKLRLTRTVTVVPNEAIEVDLTNTDFEFRQYDQYKIDLVFDKPHPARTLGGKLEEYGAGFGKIQWISCCINPNIPHPPTVSYFSHLGKIQFLFTKLENETVT